MVGTRQESIAEVRLNNRMRTSTIADQCGADEIFVVTFFFSINNFFVKNIFGKRD